MQSRTPKCSMTVAWLLFLYALAMPQLALGQISMAKGDHIDTGGLEGALKGGGADALVAALSAMHSSGTPDVIPKHTDENGEVVYDFTILQKEWSKKDETEKKDEPEEAPKPVPAATTNDKKIDGSSPALLKKSASTRSGAHKVWAHSKTLKIKSAHAKAAAAPPISDDDGVQPNELEDSGADEMAPPANDGPVESSEPAIDVGNNRRTAPKRQQDIVALWHGLRALRENIGALVDESGTLVNAGDTKTRKTSQIDSTNYVQVLNNLTALTEQKNKLEMQLQSQANETKKLEAQLQAQSNSNQTMEEQLLSQSKEIHALEASEKKDHDEILQGEKNASAFEVEIKRGRRKLAKMVKAAQMAKAAEAAAQQAAQADQAAQAQNSQDEQDSPDMPTPDSPPSDAPPPPASDDGN